MKAKRSLSFFLTLIMLLSIFPVQYVAAVDVAPTLSIESKSATPGSTVTINISIRDNPGIVAADLRLEFDEALTLVATQAGEAFSVLSFTPPLDMSSPCILSWAGESVTDEQIQDGTVVTLTFEVSEDAEVDTMANLTISCDSANDNDLYPVEIAVAEGAISIVDFMYGDVDNNFKINAADMTLIQRYLADGGRNNNENGYNVNINEKAADTFLDNKISAADVTVLKRWKAQWKDYESLPYSPPAHVHSLKYVEEKPATESTEGMMAHYGGADNTTLSNGAKVYYGDKLSVTYKANTGYSINTSGSSSITVTGNVTGTDIYATAKANTYTYTIKYRSSNGTALGSSSVSNTFGSSKTVSAPAKSGYNTPASQTVKWDATSKTITFTYTPTSVASEVRSGTISNSPYMTYYTTFEHRNRTANSVQIRVVWETTIAARNYTVYGQKFTASSGSASTGVVQVAAFNTWGSAVSSGRAATGTSNWITVPVNTTNSTLVDISVYYYQTNSNNLDMYKYNGTAAVSKVWSIRIPAY